MCVRAASWPCIAYYVAFGPHGPRTPVSPPGQGFKVFLATMGLVGVAAAAYVGIRSLGTSLFSSVIGGAQIDTLRALDSSSATEDAH